MQVRILYFGILKDIFAREGEVIDLNEGAVAGDAVRLLQARASNAQNDMWSSLAVAVNREYAPLSAALQSGDELALLPPVSGGIQ